MFGMYLMSFCECINDAMVGPSFFYFLLLSKQLQDAVAFCSEFARLFFYFTRMQSPQVPLDFISWHYYGSTVEQIEQVIPRPIAL